MDPRVIQAIAERIGVSLPSAAPAQPLLQPRTGGTTASRSAAASPVVRPQAHRPSPRAAQPTGAGWRAAPSSASSRSPSPPRSSMPPPPPRLVRGPGRRAAPLHPRPAAPQQQQQQQPTHAAAAAPASPATFSSPRPYGSAYGNGRPTARVSDSLPLPLSSPSREWMQAPPPLPDEQQQQQQPQAPPPPSSPPWNLDPPAPRVSVFGSSLPLPLSVDETADLYSYQSPEPANRSAHEVLSLLTDEPSHIYTEQQQQPQPQQQQQLASSREQPTQQPLDFSFTQTQPMDIDRSPAAPVAKRAYSDPPQPPQSQQQLQAVSAQNAPRATVFEQPEAPSSDQWQNQHGNTAAAAAAGSDRRSLPPPPSSAIIVSPAPSSATMRPALGASPFSAPPASAMAPSLWGTFSSAGGGAAATTPSPAHPLSYAARYQAPVKQQPTTPLDLSQFDPERCDDNDDQEPDETEKYSPFHEAQRMRHRSVANTYEHLGEQREAGPEMVAARPHSVRANYASRSAGKSTARKDFSRASVASPWTSGSNGCSGGGSRGGTSVQSERSQRSPIDTPARRAPAHPVPAERPQREYPPPPPPPSHPASPPAAEPAARSSWSDFSAHARPAPSQCRNSMEASFRRHRDAMLSSQQQAAVQADAESDDEDKPIARLRQPDARHVAPAAASATASAPSRNAFKPPRSAGADGSSMSGASSASRSSAMLGPQARVPRSPLLPTDVCPIRFYPPSYMRATNMTRLPSGLPVSIAPEVTALPLGDGQMLHTNALFSSPHSYAEHFTRLLCMEMQGMINPVSERFARVDMQLGQRANAQQQQQQQAYGGFVSGGGGGAASMHSVTPKVRQQHCRSQGLSYYSADTIELVSFDSNSFRKSNKAKAAREAEAKRRKQQQRNAQRRARGGYTDAHDEAEDELAEEEAEEEGGGSTITYYLRLKDTDAKERASSANQSSGCAEGDLWLLSSDPHFDMGGLAVGQKVNFSVNDWFPAPHRHHFTLFVVSKWRNFSSDRHQLKVEALPLHPSNSNTKLLRMLASDRGGRAVHALRIGNFRSEIDMLSLLNECGRDGSGHAAMLKRAPLLPLLLHGKHWAHFRDHYDSTLGWLDGADRIAAQSRAMQSMRQTRLLPSGQVSAVSKPSSSGGGGFTPLVDSSANLMPTVVVSSQTIDSIKQSIIEQFMPNEDQQKVLECAAGWFWTETEEEQMDGSTRTVLHPPTSSSVQLAHGCFGSGKSTLIVVLIVFLTRVLEIVDRECKIKIMIAALTNVAVDGILMGLQNVGVEFARVGSIKKVAPPILRHMVHMGTSQTGSNSQIESEKTALIDLRARLAEMDNNRDPEAPPSDPINRWHVVRAIEELQEKGQRRRKERLHKTRVVGITTAACEFDVMNQTDSAVRYPILLLDEASQMIEPASIVPMVRFKAERLLAVGDPKQLPPTLPGSEGHQASRNDGELTGLSRTLFVRLQQLDIPTILLRTQYRCHPLLSQIPSQLFYEGALLDGTSAEARFPFLVPLPSSENARPLPPLLFVDVPNGVEAAVQGSRSLRNIEEVAVVRRLVEMLLRHGVKPSQIGITSLYRSQVSALREAVSTVSVEALVQQPQDAAPRTPTRGKKKATFSQPPQQTTRTASGVGIQVSTVDAFQGAEKDVIILSLCRARQSTDFIDNPHRLNVSLTRAKHHLVLVGRSQTLQLSAQFKAMLTLARKTPTGYVPNVQVAASNMAKLTLNPKLLEERAVEGEDAADDSHGPAALALRSVARDFQHSAAADAGHKRRGSARSAAAPAATDPDDDDEIDPLDPPEDAAAEEDEEVDLTNTAGLSPYARQQLEERISSRSSNEHKEGADHGAGESDDDRGAESVSLCEVLSKKRARELEERVERDSKRPARRPAPKAAHSSDSDDGELDMLDTQAQQQPWSHPAESAASASDPVSSSPALLPAPSPGSFLSFNIRDAISRSSSNASGASDDAEALAWA